MIGRCRRRGLAGLIGGSLAAVAAPAHANSLAGLAVVVLTIAYSAPVGLVLLLAAGLDLVLLLRPRPGRRSRLTGFISAWGAGGLTLAYGIAAIWFAWQTNEPTLILTLCLPVCGVGVVACGLGLLLVRKVDRV